MKKLLTFAAFLLLAGMGRNGVALATDLEVYSTVTDDEYQKGDTYTEGGYTYEVKSDNMFVNGGFNDGVDGWQANFYSQDADISNFGYHTEGGFNDGHYITVTAGVGAEDVHTLCQAIQVETGKQYLFIGYTNGTAPSSGNMRYNGLMQMDSPTHEVLDEGKTEGHDAIVEAQLNWGNGTDWEKTQKVFAAETDYVGARFTWCNGARFDGMQLYEIEEVSYEEIDDDEYHEGDEYSGGAFKVESDNLFVNGGFNDGVDGWTAGGYETAADISNFTIHTTGGYNDGAYLTSNQSAGATSEHTISQAIPVEKGEFYLFIGYTSGAVPQARYSALFEMSDATTEANHEESDGNSYSNEIVRLTWGDDNATEWTKTESVFLATTDYVGMRMGWTTGSYDGFQLYKLEVVVPEDASPENPVDLTSLIINPDAYLNSSEGWTCNSEGSTLTRKNGEHWSGTSTSYFDSDSWSGYLWEEVMTQDITLPYAGVYKLTAAGRSSLNARTVLYAGDMEYTFPAIGATGGTIATDGTEWESVEAGLAAGKEFANSDQGYGWNWGSVEVVAASAGKLTIGARFEGYESETHQWASIVNFRLAYLGSSLDAVKDALAADIADAKDIDITTNVGTAPFLRPQELADALTEAIEAAEAALEASGATEESLTAALTALQAAVHDFDNAGLNAPAAGETFSIVLVQDDSDKGSVYNGYAVQSDASTNDGGYAFHFTNTPNRNYAPQNYMFTPNSDKTNGYTISFVDESGSTHYMCLGTAYSGGTNLQIRATESAESAYVFQVVPGATDGTWHIYNSDNGKNVGNGAGDGGLYTGATGDSLQLVSNAIPVNITKAGWTTLVLPYDAELPSSDLTAYTVAGQSETQENAVTLEEVTGTLTAKQPYLINGTEVKKYAINGTSTIFDLSTDASDSYLVGTWTDISSVATGNYVLQYQPDVDGTAFYIVDGTQGDITLAMNRCYLSGSSVSTASAPYFSLSTNGDTATAIEAVAEETAETAGGAIYDLSGRRVSKAQKGIYIKDGKKVIIK